MKLTYRGIAYDYRPLALATEPTGIVGQYRGVLMPFTLALNPPPPPLVTDLKYRGVAYRWSDAVTKGNVPESAIPVGATASVPSSVSAAQLSDSIGPEPGKSEIKEKKPSIKEQMRALLTQHVRNIRRREQSMLARADEKIGVSWDSIAHYEMSIQGKIPHDFTGYDRSHAAMS